MYPDEKDEVVQLYLDDIIPNRFQPREVFDENALKELAISIKEHGVIQPIIVRSVNGKYEIIAGERRYKASALAGLTKIPAIIRDLDDKESSKVALLENLQRKNLNPIEEARTYQKILEIDQMTQEELAKTMGKSQSAVANKIRLLSLPEEIQDSLLKEEISERHARTLLNIDDPKEQKEMLKKVIDNKMTVRVLEEEIKKMKSPEEPQAEEQTPLVASTDAFVNDSPLMPTADLPKDEDNYGKVTIAPPEGETIGDLPTGNKFINYGELDKEEDEDDDEDDGGSTFDMPPAVTSLDVKDVKANTEDININNSGSADLDSLLNLGNPTATQATDQFITPAEKIVKTDTEEDDEEKETDYFKPDEIPTVDSAEDIPAGLDNNKFIDTPKEEKEPIPLVDPMSLVGGTLSTENYTIEEATTKIKDLISDLQAHGIKIKSDEMNFEKSYQVIIKIDKTKEEE